MSLFHFKFWRIFAKLRKNLEYIFFLHIETASVLSSLSHALNELFLLWRLCLLSSFRDKKKQNISQHTNLIFLGFLAFSICLCVLWCLQYFALCDLVLFISHKNYHQLFFFQVLLFQILSHPNLAMWLWAFFVFCWMYFCTYHFSII